MSLSIGIDPGLSGALAVIRDGQLVSVDDTPTLLIGTKRHYDMAGMERLLHAAMRMQDVVLERFVSCVVVGIERQQAMPSQGVVSMFSTGYGYGLWRMLLHCNGVSVEEIQPKAWRKHFSLPAGKPLERKRAALAKATDLFPAAPLTGPKGGAKDGRADALLIAEYTRWRRSG